MVRAVVSFKSSSFSEGLCLQNSSLFGPCALREPLRPEVWGLPKAQGEPRGASRFAQGIQANAPRTMVGVPIASALRRMIRTPNIGSNIATTSSMTTPSKSPMIVDSIWRYGGHVPPLGIYILPYTQK
ncbi:unnamed protein product [Effrenium voratum]|nr:unnamed protein product [Effrenium voratum]